MNKLFRRIHYLVNRRRLADELKDEMEFHREMSIQNGHGDDSNPFGNTLRLREESRDAWGWTWLDRAFQDIRYALRTMRRSPGFTLAAVLMLAIGIGINVAAFGFFNIVMFRPLPVREPDTLLRIQRVAPGQYASDIAYPAMQFYREHSRTLSAVLALDVGHLMSADTGATVKAFFVTSNFFRELGATPEIGRLLPETTGTREPLAVLGYDYWQTRFNADPTVPGRTIRLNGKTVTVLGVVSRNFSGLTFSLPDVWMSLEQQPDIVTGSKLLTNLSPDSDGVDIWGRIRTGASTQAVEEELRILTAELRRQHPNDFWENERPILQPGGYAQNAGGRNRATAPSPSLQAKLYPIFGLIGALSLLILAVTCGNVGSLLLARGVARQREISIRSAVGAGKARLIRQLLTESLVLSFLGGGAALFLGYIVLQQTLRRTDAPRWLDLTPDWRVLAFTLAIACLSAIFFGITPALQLIRSFRRATMARHVLIATQVAASCVLLIVAGLLLRGIHRAISGHPGFEYKQVISIDPRLGFHGHSSADARNYLDRLQMRLRSMPGVESISLAVSPPLGNRSTTFGGEKNGKTFPIYLNLIDAHFFDTMKIALLRGRNLRPAETQSVVVSESLASHLWPGEEPLDKIFSVGEDKYPVVGVVADARANALADVDAVEVYRIASDHDLPGVAVLVRVAGPAEAFVQSIAAQARSTDSQVMPSIQTLSSAFDRKIEGTRNSATAAGILGGVALALAALGIVGVVAYAVSQREKEIAIRMAIGAQPARVLGAIAQHFWIPITVGLLVGTAGAAGLTQFLRREIYGVSPLDPFTYLAAIALLATLAALAVWIPARRALAVDPIKALRCE